MPIFSSITSRSFIKRVGETSIKKVIEFDHPARIRTGIDANDGIIVVGDNFTKASIYNTQTGELIGEITNESVTTSIDFANAVAINRLGTTTGVILIGNPRVPGYANPQTAPFDPGLYINVGNIIAVTYDTATNSLGAPRVQNDGTNTLAAGLAGEYGQQIIVRGNSIYIGTDVATLPTGSTVPRILGTTNLFNSGFGYDTFSRVEWGGGYFDVNGSRILQARGQILTSGVLTQTITRPPNYTVSGNFGSYGRFMGSRLAISDDNPNGNIYVYLRGGDTYFLEHVIENPGYASYFDITSNLKIASGNKVFSLTTGELIEQLDFDSPSEYVVKYPTAGFGSLTNYVITSDGSKIRRYYRDFISRPVYRSLSLNKSNYDLGETATVSLTSFLVPNGTKISAAIYPPSVIDGENLKTLTVNDGAASTSVTLKDDIDQSTMPDLSVFLLPTDDRKVDTRSLIDTASISRWKQSLIISNPNLGDAGADSTTATNDEFARSIAMNERYIAVGAPNEQDLTDETETGRGSGAVYVFDRYTGDLVIAIENPNTQGTKESDSFGSFLSMNEEFLYIGAIGEDDTTATDVGKVYRYQLSDFTRVGTFSTNVSYSGLGRFFSASNSWIAIGIPDNPSEEEVLENEGTVTVANAQQTLTFNIFNPDPQPNDRFGSTIAVSQSHILIGCSGTQRSFLYSVRPNGEVSSPVELEGNIVALSDTKAYVGTSASDSSGGTVYDIDNFRIVPPYTVLDNPNAYGTSLSDFFSWSVDTDNDRCIVGAYTEDDADGSISGKAYIFDVTTGALLHTLDNPNTYGISTNDVFARSVAISGDRCIVGAQLEDVSFAQDTGKAYIFDVTTGALLHTLENPNAYGTAVNDNFGFSVSISGDRCIVSALGEDDAGGTASGKAYIFDVTDGSLLHTLDNPTAYGTSGGDQFGNSVSISGDRCIVGAFNEDDAGGTGSGKAYIFDVVTGALLHTLDNPTAYGISDFDYFGEFVSISGDRCIVSARLEDDADNVESGKAYIFDVVTGALLHTLDNPNAYGTSLSDQFSYSVAISGDRCIVGAYLEDDAGGLASGKAYIFSVTTGELLHTLDNPNAFGTSLNDNFGISVSISGNRCIVGAYGEDDAGSGSTSGKAYIFDLEKTGSTVTELFKVPNVQNDNIGSTPLSVSLSNDYLAIGIPGYDDSTQADAGKIQIYDITGELISEIENPTEISDVGDDKFGGTILLKDDTLAVAIPDKDNNAATTKGYVYTYNLRNVPYGLWKIDANTVLALEFQTGLTDFRSSLSAGSLTATADAGITTYVSTDSGYKAAVIDSSNKIRITGSYFDSFDWRAESWTLEGFFKVQTYAQDHVIAFAGGFGVTNWNVYIGTGSDYIPAQNQVGYGRPSVAASVVSLEKSPDQPFHLAVVHQNGRLAVFYNGRRIIEDTEFTTSDSTATYLDIGGVPFTAGGTDSSVIVWGVRWSNVARYDPALPVADFARTPGQIDSYDSTNDFVFISPDQQSVNEGSDITFHVLTGTAYNTSTLYWTADLYESYVFSQTLSNPNAYGTSQNDRFGWSVSISGDRCIVGAYLEDDAGGSDSGKAYIFDVTTGALLHTLDNPNTYGTSVNDRFGWSVSISGDRCIVGAYLENDTGGSDSGKAYIFDVTDGSLLHTLDNPNTYYTSANDNFGISVAISGDRCIVGAFTEDDAGGFNSGKAYIFDVTDGSLLHTLDNPNAYGTSANDRFGYFVAISGDRCIVSARLEDDAGGSDSGKAYIFDVTTGALLHTLDNPRSSSSDNFGSSVAISGDRCIVGAYLEDDENFDSGKAYIFDVTTGALLHTLDNPNAYKTSTGDLFGYSVAISGDRCIVGAYQEDDADGFSSGISSGKAYIFDVTTGNLIHTLDNPNATGGSSFDYFGQSVSIDSDRVIVGAFNEDDAGGTGSGKAYIFTQGSQLRSGTVNIDSNGRGSFSVIPTADFTTEGTETFTVNVRSSSTEGTILATSAAVTINDTSLDSVYSVVPDNLVVSEGKSIGFNVVTEFVPDGTVIYWTVRFGDGSTDFAQPSGSMIVRSNRSRFSVTTAADFVTEGTETFQAEVRITDIAGPVVATSVAVTILDTSRETYTVTPAASSVNEGSSLTFTVNTQGIPDGATLYWTVTPSAEFAAASGSFTINSNTGTFAVTPLADQTIEGTETFSVAVRIDSISGTVVARSRNIVINDTSRGTFNTVFSPSSAFPGDTVTATVTTQGVTNGTRLFYTIGSTATLGEFEVNNNRGTFSFVTAFDQYSDSETDTVTVSIRSNNLSGPIEASPTFTLVDYAVVPAANNVNEGSSLTFTVTAYGGIPDTTLYWNITNQDDFSTITGSFTMVAGTGTFSVTPTEDYNIEGPETFSVTVRSSSGSGPIVATSTNVTINDGEGPIDNRWNVSAAIYSKQLSIVFEETLPRGIFFKPDGTKMYVIGGQGIDVNEYDLSVPWDIGFSVFLQNKSISAQESAPQDLFFKPDGTKMYIIGSNSDSVHEYDLSPAWDVNSASFLQSKSVAAQESFPTGLFFKPDGTKMYVSGNTTSDSIYEYDLSPAWDVNSASFLQSKSVAAQDGGPSAVFFKPDGTRMYVLGLIFDRVYEYNLTAWDVSTATLSRSKSISAQGGIPTGLFFKSDGSKMYTSESSTRTVREYDIPIE